MKTISIFLFLPFVVIFTVDGFSQSLAEAARRERQRQQTAHATVVIAGAGSGASVSETSPAEPADHAAPARQSTPETKPTKGPTDDKGRDEKFWRAAFQQAREDLKRAETKVELLDLRLKELNTQLLRQSDIYNRENRIGAEITATQKELEDARRQAEQAKKKIAELEEDLRKSGGPPGWAR